MTEEANITPGPKQPEYSLSLTGPGLTIETKLPQEAALQVVAIAMGGAGASMAPLQGPRHTTPASSSAAAGGAGRMSVREYIDSVEAKRNPDKIVAIAKYLQVHRGQELFTSDEIKAQFRPAGEPLPGNWARDFRWAIQNGWIAEDHAEKGQFYVTDSGTQALESRFSSDVKKRTGVSTRRRKKKTNQAEEE